MSALSIAQPDVLSGSDVREVTLKLPQAKVFGNSQRFRSLVAGRRFGKTFLAVVELMTAANEKPGQTCWYVAPTYKQAKQNAWNILKKLSYGRCVGKPHETELSVVLRNGSTIALKGADNYDSLRGAGLNFLILDEFASMKPEAWVQVLRPTLSDKLGRALFIGTPKGFNHFHELHDRAKTDPDWAAFEFTTLDGGNVSSDEIHSASRDLDAKMFRQEYCASFETIGFGKAYYSFIREKNLGDLTFDRYLPLAWSLDFNVNPMCSVIGQVEDVSTRFDVFAGRVEKKLRILEEICLPDSNIDAACREFCRRTEAYRKAAGGQMVVNIYGDASGHNRTHSGTTNWQVVEEFFRSRGEYRISMNVTRTNPLVRDRANAVNAALCNSLGEVRVQIAPQCKQLIADLEQVSWKADSNGNLTGEMDKSDPNRTHVSDAFGYLVWAELPIRGSQSVYGQGFIG